MTTTTLLKTYPISLVAETSVVLGLSLIFPVAVHLLPNVGGIPMGARLLPIFFVPLLSIYLLPASSVFLASILSPGLNMLVTGNPRQEILLPLTIQLMLYTSLVYVFKKKSPRSIFIGPVAYTISALFISLGQFMFHSSSGIGMTIQMFTKSYLVSLPGVLALLLLSIYVRRMEHSHGAS